MNSLYPFIERYIGLSIEIRFCTNWNRSCHQFLAWK